MSNYQLSGNKHITICKMPNTKKILDERNELIPRICKVCSKDKGTMAFRYKSAKESKRDYFHPKCFKKFLGKVEKE